MYFSEKCVGEEGKRGRNDAVLVVGLKSVFIRAVKAGIRVEADPMEGKGASSNKTSLWNLTVFEESLRSIMLSKELARG